MSIPKAGALVRASDWSTVFPLDADAWATYTPSLTQSTTVTKTVSLANYTKVGRVITARLYLVVTGAGTASNVVLFGLPVAAGFGAGPIGAGYLYDASAGTFYNSVVDLASNTTGRLLIGTATQYAGGTGGVFTAGLAAGDVVAAAVTYESAS